MKDIREKALNFVLPIIFFAVELAIIGTAFYLLYSIAPVVTMLSAVLSVIIMVVVLVKAGFESFVTFTLVMTAIGIVAILSCLFPNVMFEIGKGIFAIILFILACLIIFAER